MQKECDCGAETTGKWADQHTEGCASLQTSPMKRLPIIRHIRYFYWRYRVNQHYDMWGSVGMLPVHAHRDYAVLDKIWAGEQ